jgi:hypothetical protein
LKKDGHWSTAGHQLAAEIVAARIEPFRKQYSNSFKLD